MTDIVDKLTSASATDHDGTGYVMDKAANEITRLRWAIYQAGSMHAGGVPVAEIMDFLHGVLDKQEDR